MGDPGFEPGTSSLSWRSMICGWLPPFVERLANGQPVADSPVGFAAVASLRRRPPGRLSQPTLDEFLGARFRRRFRLPSPDATSPLPLASDAAEARHRRRCELAAAATIPRAVKEPVKDSH
jgi:hypothetical protein